MDYKAQREKALIKKDFDCRVPCNLTFKQREILKKLTTNNYVSMGRILQVAFEEYLINHEIE